MRRGCLLLLICSLLLMHPAGSGMVHAAPSVSVHAEAAVLIDVKSGRILFSRQGDKPMRIASLTKIMTAIVAIEHGELSDQVQVSRNAFGKEGSSLYLKLGEEMNLQHLLYGLMLRSGNDAATAIAEHVGETQEGFVHLMNEKAKMLGMTGTSFKNPSGLDEEGHYSTANDLAKLTAYALKNPVFQEIVRTKVKKVPNPNEPWDYSWTNKNKMLGLYEGADGVKTGYTKLAKRCLVSSATRGGQQLAVVTLNDPDDWVDHSRLLDYGFEHYPLMQLAEKGKPLGKEGFVAGAGFEYPAEQSEREQFTVETSLNDQRSAHYRLGEVGRATFKLGGQTIGSVPLVAEGSPRLQLKERAAFSFGEARGDSGSWGQQWFDAVRTLAKLLFTGSL